MKITCYGLHGRLGNIIEHLYSFFNYCIKNNINLDDIFFNKNGFYLVKERIDYFISIRPFFVNIQKYFIDDCIYKKYINEKDTIVIFDKYTPCGPYNNINFKLYKKLFFNKDLWENINKRCYESSNIVINDYIAVHVRRTDYKKYQNGKYLETVDNICNRIKNIDYNKIIFFSDDSDWCKNNINKKLNFNFKYACDLEKFGDYEQLILMSMCKNICMPPASTYSYNAYILNNIYYNKI